MSVDTGSKRSHSADGGDDGTHHQHPPPPPVQSLTIRFNQRSETWRSPPTYYGGVDFVWPPGWIEVQRIRSASPSSSDDDRRDGTTSRPEAPRPPPVQRDWIREFHPPTRRGPGKTKVCHSIDDVKKHVEREKAKRLKQERFASVGADSRRSGRSRKTNSLGQSGMASYASVDPTLRPQEGTQGELNKIMKQRSRLSERMYKSIVYGAVLARKKDLLESESGFLGANGRMYPDLRKAFGKHVDVKQCALCKSRVQGNWYCRISHCHLDKPDFDGEDSAEYLIELFRCSVDVLEAKLLGLLPGGRKKGSQRYKDAVLEGFESGSGWSMNILSEDILYQVASFLPTLSQLVTFCKTSKLGQRLLYRSVHSEKLFRGVFLRTFGEQGTRGNFERNLSWRERWFMIRDLRRGLLQKSIRPPNAIARRMRETVGVLLPQEEREAIFYDNPGYGDPERAHCNGYFAMEIVHLPPPPNAGPDWRPPIFLRGDFNGIRIFNSPSHSLFHRDSPSDGGGNQNRYLSIGHDEAGGQVLSLIHCDLDHASLQKTDRGEGRTPPCCFIGYASGGVAAVSATLAAGGNEYAFSISGRHHAHESEVTALSFVDCGSAPGDDDVPVLFSACCAGKVYFYPNAFDPAQNFGLEESVLAFSNFYDCPVFSMASTAIRSRGRSSSVLCTGDRDGNIRVWLKPDDDLAGLCARRGPKFRHIQAYKSSTHRGTGFHLVTRAMFVRDDLLITGTNNGDVRFWQLQFQEDPLRNIGKGPLPNLTLRYDLIGIHNGAVELLMIVGDILLTSGGNDGKIVGWDITTGLKLGSVGCHPGRQIEEWGGTYSSCVVDMLMSGKDGSLISLCRDGNLRQLKLMV